MGRSMGEGSGSSQRHSVMSVWIGTMLMQSTGQGLDAQFAAGALLLDYGMHLLGRAENRIHWAGLDAQGAADADVLVDDGDGLFLFLFFQGCRLAIEQIGQGLHRGLPTGRAAVDVRLAGGDRLGIGAAAGIGALAALGLREQGIDLVHYRVLFDAKALCGKAEDQPERGGQTADREDGIDDAHSRTSPEKPMNASDIRPAVTMATALPRKTTGTSATAMRSRMAENRISTMEKPTAAPKP